MASAKHGQKHRNRRIYHIRTGGTIGSVANDEGVRVVNEGAQRRTASLLESTPFTEFVPVRTKLRGDSSAHPYGLLADLGRTALGLEEGDGIVIEYGTDTMNLTAPTLALLGNELWRYPVTLLGSMKGPDEKDRMRP